MNRPAASPSIISHAITVALVADVATAAEGAWVQVLPAGEFRAWDGRPEQLNAWKLDAATASRLIELAQAGGPSLVIDYEHQTLNAQANGQPAPAAGWMQRLEWREGAGLFALVSWTARAREAIRAEEYRYFSPVFESDPKTGVVTRLLMGAITNFPGLDGMMPVAARATPATEQENLTVNKLLAAIVAALSLPAETTEDQATAAITALSAKLADRDREITALKATAPLDAAKFVPLAAFDQVKGELAALTAKLQGNEVEAQIAAGLADGRIHTSLESWARDLGKTSPAALKSYLDTATPIAALTGQQTGGKPPAIAATGVHGLTAEELAICSAAGTTPEAYAKAKTA